MGSNLLLASYPKSGNTWVRVFLVNLFANAREPLPLAEIGRLSTGDNVAAWYRAIDPSDDAAWSNTHIARLRHDVQRHVAGRSPDTVFLKTHAALLPMEGVPPFAPDVLAGAVYIVRNPLDVAVSYARHSGVSLDGAIATMEHNNYTPARFGELLPYLQGGWSQNVASWTMQPHPRIHVMRYEDMVADPPKAFAGLTRFLEIEVAAERLERAIANSDIAGLRRQEQAEGFIERPNKDVPFFGPGLVGAGKDTLTTEQIARICARHRAQMARFGYLPDA